MKQLILILILINFILYSIIFDFLTDKRFCYFLDVGQGSSVLCKNKKNTFLYDTGKYPSLVLKQIDQVIPFYLKKIDILFISHPDKDHYKAAFEVIKRYKVRLLVTNGFIPDDIEYRKFLKLALDLKIPIIYLKRGDRIYDNHFRFLVLNPANVFYKKDNDNSLVLKIKGLNSYLLTGDIEKLAINDILKCCKKDLRSDYFLVPHHGSKYSINEDFYKAISPKLSIIQVGENFYNHPHKEVLISVSKYSDIWRTDKDGSLILKE